MGTRYPQRLSGTSPMVAIVANPYPQRLTLVPGCRHWREPWQNPS